MLPGKPDIVLAQHRKVVFVHGCFWHRHGICRALSIPENNAEFWERKFEGNARRDREKIAALIGAGWKVLVVWECQTKDRDKLERTLRNFMSNDKGKAPSNSGKKLSRKAKSG